MINITVTNITVQIPLCTSLIISLGLVPKEHDLIKGAGSVILSGPPEPQHQYTFSPEIDGHSRAPH